MTNVTLKDVFEIANRIEDKLDRVETRVSVLEVWRGEITGRIAVVGALIILVVNLTFDWIKSKVKFL